MVDRRRRFIGGVVPLVFAGTWGWVLPFPPSPCPPPPHVPPPPLSAPDRDPPNHPPPSLRGGGVFFVGVVVFFSGGLFFVGCTPVLFFVCFVGFTFFFVLLSVRQFAYVFFYYPFNLVGFWDFVFIPRSFLTVFCLFFGSVSFFVSSTLFLVVWDLLAVFSFTFCVWFCFYFFRFIGFFFKLSDTPPGDTPKPFPQSGCGSGNVDRVPEGCVIRVTLSLQTHGLGVGGFFGGFFLGGRLDLFRRSLHPLLELQPPVSS